MNDPAAVDPSDYEDTVGFTDSEGKWITMAELQQKYGDSAEVDVRELAEELDDIGMARTRRDEDGNPVSIQLSQFAVDLMEAEGNDEVVAVYLKHGEEPPESVRKEWLRRFREKKNGK